MATPIAHQVAVLEEKRNQARRRYAEQEAKRRAMMTPRRTTSTRRIWTREDILARGGMTPDEVQAATRGPRP